jgi:hypothetical protein
VFGCDVDRCVQVGCLACDAAYDDDAFGVCGTGFGALGGVKEGGYGELGRADGMCNIDVEGGVAAAVDTISRFGASWGMPEVGPVSL